MSPELLAILVCPRTKNKLQMADAKTLQKVNDLIDTGKCINIGNEPMTSWLALGATEKIREGLWEPKTKVFYLIREGIPLLIYENGIQL